jgi:hypothetical protein
MVLCWKRTINTNRNSVARYSVLLKDTRDRLVADAGDDDNVVKVLVRILRFTSGKWRERERDRLVAADESVNRMSL